MYIAEVRSGDPMRMVTPSDAANPLIRRHGLSIRNTNRTYVRCPYGAKEGPPVGSFFPSKDVRSADSIWHSFHLLFGGFIISSKALTTA